MEAKNAKKSNSKKQTTNKKTQVKKVVSEEPKKNSKKEVKVITKKTEPKTTKTVVKEKINDGRVTSNEITNLIKIILAVTVIFLIFYGITTLVTKNKKTEQLNTGDVVIQYDEILLGNLLEQPKSEYYVLVTEEDDQYKDTYSTYLNTYKTKENAIRVYSANLDSGFNSAYLSETSNTNINDIKDLKLSTSTLLKVSGKKVVSAYEGNFKIIEHLKTLIK